MGEAITARREMQAVEARAYRDKADLNAVLRLTAPHKQRVLGALLKQSPEKLKKEADARAFRGKLGFSVHFLSFSRGLHRSPAPLRKFS